MKTVTEWRATLRTRRHAHRHVPLHTVVHRVRLHCAGRVRHHPALRFGDHLAGGVRHAPDALLTHVIHPALTNRALPLLRHHPARRHRDRLHTHFRYLLHHAPRLVPDVIFLHHPARRVAHLTHDLFRDHRALSLHDIANVLLAHPAAR